MKPSNVHLAVHTNQQWLCFYSQTGLNSRGRGGGRLELIILNPVWLSYHQQREASLTSCGEKQKELVLTNES